METRERISGDYFKGNGSCGSTSTYSEPCVTRTRISNDYCGRRYAPTYGSSWFSCRPTTYYEPAPVVYSRPIHATPSSCGEVLASLAICTLLIAGVGAIIALGSRCHVEEVCDPFDICHLERVCLF